LKRLEKSGIIRKRGVDLQLSASKDLRDQVNEYAARQEVYKPDEDWRIQYYSRENINRACYFYQKNLKGGIVAPDGKVITVTERDFHKAITDYKLLLKPELIKEIIRNANVKIRQANGRDAYYSYKPAGYVVAGDITYSVHYLGRHGLSKVNGKIRRDIQKGGEIRWERD
jgi:hypothetical protein